MKMRFFFPALALFIFSCNSDDNQADNIYQCATIPLKDNLSRTGLINSFSTTLLQNIAAIDIPTDEGAMGRNKNGYFHVRFQMGISAQADFAVTAKSSQALEYAIKSIEYSFSHQLVDGSFELVVPGDLSDQTPNEADLASGVSFFLSSVGLALNDFDESTWYNLPSNEVYQQRVQALRPNIESAAMWLLSKKAILEVADKRAPNRLFFNALALYSLGKWLDNEVLEAAGLDFAGLGVSTKHSTGYFLEGDGWDSSYQGVSINVGFNLYSLMPDTEVMKGTLWNCLSCASDWMKSRVLASGEISTEGNTRVFEGGETFLGQQKGLDWIKGMIGLFAMGYYSGEKSFTDSADKVLSFYR